MTSSEDFVNPYAPPTHSGRSAEGPSTGRVDPLRFALAVLACLAGSAGLAGCLAALFWSGGYLVILVPGLVAIVASCGVFWAIRLGHCRNRWLGMFLGLACGCLIFFGYYHIDMVGRAGPWALLRLDALPQYIAFRVQSDVSTPTDNPNANATPFWPMNLFAFCLEFGLIAWLCSVAGLRAASRAYDESRGRWGEVARTTIGFGLSRVLLEARQKGNLTAGLAAVERVANQVSTPHCMLALESFPSESSEPPRAFLSGYELRMPGQALVINPVYSPRYL